MIKTVILTLACFFSMTSFSKTYEVNTQHSFVNFEIDYMKVSTVKGSFDKFEGVFQWDEKTGKLSQVAFKIFAESVNTRDIKRDNHLRRKDFFHVRKFPLITFKGEEVVHKKGVPTLVRGMVTIKDISKKMEFDLNWKGLHRDPVDKKKRSLFLETEGTINRQDFGITWNKAMDSGGWIVGDLIKFDLIIEANPTDARAPFSRFYMKKSEVLPGTTDEEAVFGKKN